ncbi:MAG: hypothetical protein KatS3mg103_0562 [Phycisphaerales bacterium]|nr:MAG: hypothetical protein KatS3mg103_0562 [Phycisphaerales bacterium]
MPRPTPPHRRGPTTSLPCSSPCSLPRACPRHRPQAPGRGSQPTGQTGAQQAAGQGDRPQDPPDTDHPQASPGGPSAQPLPSGLEGFIKALVQKLGNVRFDAIGLVGGLVLIYAALAMVVEVERCFNQICRAQSGRSWSRRITQYWTMLTLGAILIAMTFLVGVQVREWVRSAAGQGDGLGRLLVAAAGFLVTVAISTGLLTLAYLVLPNRRLRLRPVLAGATVAAVGWEAAKWGFTQYLGFATSSTSTYANLYGSLALIPLFMLWIFLTWLIVLFGLQVAYGVQMLEDGLQQDDATHEPPVVLAWPGVFIDAAAAVARRFDQGRQARAEDLADELGLSAQQAEGIFEALQGQGVVRRLDGGTGYTLARPAERIRVADLLQLGIEAMAARPGSASVQLARASLQRLGDRTLAEHLHESTPTPAGHDQGRLQAPRPEES